ncbi:MAG: 50S ribosomal protein L24 [Bacteroidales bacterium]|jgi:large subunit ribosomal protein L24|nr:50S ribosomal protein L24 [Bacteroidales bacterium]MBR0314518.1 50S ribosomal protein L24 [Bacteroidales bacterium]MBR6971958.1 50S ribosomal protein L24 [Bacteroidales bacterium]
MNAKFHVKKGDMVFVNAGNEKGKTGKVLRVDHKNMRAIVEGLNMVSKNTKPNANNPQGGIIKQEAPIHISNLQLVDPSKGGPTRIGRRLNDKGKLVRYAKKSGEEIK